MARTIICFILLIGMHFRGVRPSRRVFESTTAHNTWRRQSRGVCKWGRGGEAGGVVFSDASNIGTPPIRCEGSLDTFEKGPPESGGGRASLGLLPLMA